MAGGARGALLQMEIPWNPLDDGDVVWLNFASDGGFRKANDRCEMKFSNLKAQVKI